MTTSLCRTCFSWCTSHCACIPPRPLCPCLKLYSVSRSETPSADYYSQFVDSTFPTIYFTKAFGVAVDTFIENNL